MKINEIQESWIWNALMTARHDRQKPLLEVLEELKNDLGIEVVD